MTQDRPDVPRYSYRVFWSSEDGEYVGVCPEFPALSALMPTAKEALAEIQTVVAEAIALYAREGWALPEPAPVLEPSSHSGQFRLRVPQSLHADLVARAERDGVSLNALCNTYLARGLGSAEVQAAIADLIVAQVAQLSRAHGSAPVGRSAAAGGLPAAAERSPSATPPLAAPADVIAIEPHLARAAQELGVQGDIGTASPVSDRRGARTSTPRIAAS